MADQTTEKPHEEQKFEKLPTIFGAEIAQHVFRIIGPSWDRFKSAFNFRDEKVFGKFEDGEFQVYDEDAKAYVPKPYGNYDYYDIETKTKQFKGRLVDPNGAPWDIGNFEVLTKEGWVAVDYNELSDGGAKIERVNKLKHVHYLPVAFQEDVTITTKKGSKLVTRAKLELSKTAYDALLNTMATFEKAGVDPKEFWYAFQLLEEEKKYVIDQSKVAKLTAEEKATATEEDEAAQTSAIDALEPAEFAIEDIPF